MMARTSLRVVFSLIRVRQEGVPYKQPSNLEYKLRLNITHKCTSESPASLNSALHLSLVTIFVE